MIYFLLALFGALVGAVVGVGGGVIIRPLLSALGVAKGLASFTSSLTVFSMSLTNYIILKIKGKKIEFGNILLIGLGTVAGGFLGGALMDFLSEDLINIAYLGAIFIIFVSVVMRDRVEMKPVHNPFVKILLGLFCGTLSSLFGIGGGPFLMSVLLIFLALDPKEAAIQSILITIFSSVSALTNYTINGYTDFSLALYCIPAGILGGVLGRKISTKISGRLIKKLFYAVLILIILIQMNTIFLIFA